MFAEIVLGLFIPLAIGSFFFARPLTAALLVALGGDMFLPEETFFHIPLLPHLHKHNLPYLCIFIGCLLRCPRRVTKLPKEKWIVLLATLVLAGGAGTAWTNLDPVILEGTAIQAMNFKDGMFVGISLFFQTGLCFYLGYALVREEKSLEKVILAFGIAGLVYCPFAIYEMRMSPQLHRMFYGVFPGGAFGQTLRWGGYRPTIFMPHGLAVARFFMATTLSLFVLSRIKRSLLGIPLRFLAWFQCLILVLCRSSGAIALALLGILVLKTMKAKKQLLFASILAIASFLYPVLRSANLFPVADLLDAAGALQSERQESLGFRFANEDILLAHARERPLFGWGTYGRNRVYDRYGRDLSTTDGWWIIVFGVAGAVGFISAFGYLVYPVLIARRRVRSLPTNEDRHAIAGAALILALLTVDLIPNALWCYYPFFLAGALTRPLSNYAAGTGFSWMRVFRSRIRRPSNS